MQLWRKRGSEADVLVVLLLGWGWVGGILYVSNVLVLIRCLGHLDQSVF